MLIKPEVSSANPGSLASAATFVSDLIPTFTELTTTAAVLDPAIQQLGLKTSADALENDVSAIRHRQDLDHHHHHHGRDAEGVAELANAVASSLIKQIQATGTSSAAVGVTGTVVEAPVVPASPNSPVFLIDLLIALAVGIAIAFLFVVTRESLRNSAPRSAELPSEE